MTGPTPQHQRVLDEILTELRGDPDVRGVLLAGSLARGSARPDSDLDVLVVTAGTDGARPWQDRGRALPVDLVARTAAEWRRHFAPAAVGDESWGYAFLDGRVLHDPDGIVARLVDDVPAVHARYRVPAPVRAHYAAFWRHVGPKMRAVLERDDPVETGWAAAVLTDHVLRTLWAVNDRPNPSLDLGTVQRHLDDLTVPADAPARVRAVLRAAPREALRLQLQLVETVATRLDEP